MQSHLGDPHMISGETHTGCWSHWESHLSQVALEKSIQRMVFMSQCLNARVFTVKMCLSVVA